MLYTGEKELDCIWQGNSTQYKIFLALEKGTLKRIRGFKVLPRDLFLHNLNFFPLLFRFFNFNKKKLGRIFLTMMSFWMDQRFDKKILA